MELLSDPTVRRIAAAEELVWINPHRRPAALQNDGVRDASARLLRFAPLIARLFPETAAQGGLIESVLTEIPHMRENFPGLRGRLLLKRDSDLPVAGSVKARGGVHEVLCHTEKLALESGLLQSTDDDYTKLLTEDARTFFGRHCVQVGSTGNLGVSIGIMSAALGFRAVVHMSADAKQWKKNYLRAHGVTVREYAGDYGSAVAAGRKASAADRTSYFVDDENSRDLFFGYAVAAERLDAQLRRAGIAVDGAHPLFVYLPCGVGGAPGGIAYGLKLLYGENAHVFFTEPTQACCMLLGLVTGKHSAICVQDVGLTAKTHADGLAVGRPSGFVGQRIAPLLAGEATADDARLYDDLRALHRSEGLFIEPSACAAFAGVRMAAQSPEFRRYCAENGLDGVMEQATHIAWATGGMLVPADVRRQFLETYL